MQAILIKVSYIITIKKGGQKTEKRNGTQKRNRLSEECYPAGWELIIAALKCAAKQLTTKSVSIHNTWNEQIIYIELLALVLFA